MTETPTPTEIALRERLKSPDAAIPMLPDFAHRVIDMVSDEDVSVS